ncbi:MAG TPA: peptide-methionine (S)-S-oxide reductase MsrA [Rhodothermales bacterium]|nr:peptide-methionine (S)-S-oxide reductase MsrA [Rhodothermales bacterium]
MNRTFELLALLLVAGLLLAGCANSSADGPSAEADMAEAEAMTVDIDPANADTATFAGGCFWCMEPPYDKLDGVAATISGYAGGSVANPTYEQVSSGATGHAEVVNIIYDATTVDFETLLYVYWRNVDLLDDGGQFCDRGSSYRPVIFYHNEEQRQRAEASKEEVAERFDQPVVVPIQPLDAFYPAEDYHQNFYRKDPRRYKSYRTGCGRDARLRQLWGDEAGGAMVESGE